MPEASHSGFVDEMEPGFPSGPYCSKKNPGCKIPVATLIRVSLIGGVSSDDRPG
jgi:hypothetical protein